VIEWFDLGGSLQLDDMMSAKDVLEAARQVQGLVPLVHAAGIPKSAAAPMLAAGIDFVLEGFYATKKISRSDERGYHASDPAPRRSARESALSEETPIPTTSGKKKYYN
jgi:magnesium chelatase subunit I